MHFDRIPTKDALTFQARRKTSSLHSFPSELREERSREGIYSGQILTYSKIATRFTPCQNLSRQITRPAGWASSRGIIQQFPSTLLLQGFTPKASYISSTIASTTQSFPRSRPFTRIPLPPWGQFLRLILPDQSKATTSTSLIDHYFNSTSKILLSWNQLHHQIISYFECCNDPTPARTVTKGSRNLFHQSMA